MEIKARFVRKHVPPIKGAGVFEGDGHVSIGNGVLHVRGSRVPSQNIRLVLGVAWYIGVVSAAAFVMLLAYPEGVSGQTGLGILAFLFAYIASNHFHWVNEDFEVPLSDILAVASDPARGLLALSISGHAHATPIVMLASNPSAITETIRELTSNAETLDIMQMSADPLITVPSTSQRVIAIVTVSHAVLVTAWWWAAIDADIDIPVVNGRVWFVAAWAWVFWPVYVFARAKVTRLTAAALIFGVAMIAPAIPTLYAFTVWSIGGFAP